MAVLDCHFDRFHLVYIFHLKFSNVLWHLIVLKLFIDTKVLYFGTMVEHNYNKGVYNIGLTNK